MLDEDFQELMKHRPELRPLFERKRGTSRYQAHWALKAKWKLDKRIRTIPQLRAQLGFAQVATDCFGKKGFDEKGIPVVASNVQKKTRGKQFKEKKKIPEWQKMVERVEGIKKERMIIV